MEKLFSEYIKATDIKMNKRMNWVGHCYNRLKNHDKLYIITIEETDNDHEKYDKKYEVYARWGRTGKNLKKQNKGAYLTYEGAMQAAYNLFTTKLVKGYSDLSQSDPNYTGSLSLDHPNVEPYLVEEEENLLDDGEFIVVCKDNVLMKTKFDVGVEYVARRNDVNHSLFDVEDRFGEVQVITSNRFEIIPA